MGYSGCPVGQQKRAAEKYQKYPWISSLKVLGFSGFGCGGLRLWNLKLMQVHVMLDCAMLLLLLLPLLLRCRKIFHYTLLGLCGSGSLTQAIQAWSVGFMTHFGTFETSRFSGVVRALKRFRVHGFRVLGSRVVWSLASGVRERRLGSCSWFESQASPRNTKPLHPKPETLAAVTPTTASVPTSLNYQGAT